MELFKKTRDAVSDAQMSIKNAVAISVAAITIALIALLVAWRKA